MDDEISTKFIEEIKLEIENTADAQKRRELRKVLSDTIKMLRMRFVTESRKEQEERFDNLMEEFINRKREDRDTKDLEEELDRLKKKFDEIGKK